MKIILSLSLALGVLGTLYAQQISVRSYVEQTHISPKMGMSIGLEFTDKIELGGFYQTECEFLTSEESGLPAFREKEFYGFYFAYPLDQFEDVDIKFNIRTGVTNGQNFVITPSLLAGYEPVRKVMINAGIGIRAFRPTLLAGLKFSLASS